MLRLGVIPDYREEQWPSMDIVADMLLREIDAGRAGDVRAESLCPPFKKRFMRLPILGSRGVAFNADRVLNRMRDYPKHLAIAARGFDAYHVCDHAYANGVHALPAERTGVFCHDLDTFRCLFEPDKEPRPRWFKTMMRRVLSGLEKAAIVFHTTQEIRRQIVARGIVEEKRLVRALLGVADVFSPDETEADSNNAILKKLDGRRYLLHVGSCIPRKRIEVLLSVFAGLRARHPELWLVKVGGPFTKSQSELSAKLNLESSLMVVDRLGLSELAVLYRHAAAVLQPSDAEGFGLPVAEALACSSAVIASAIPTIMEVGGDAVVYCPVADVERWVAVVDGLLSGSQAAPERERRLRQAAKYSWQNYAGTICDAYRKLGTGR